MRNPEWVSLTDSERGQLVAIWLLAADHDGVIPASPSVIQKLCYLSEPLNLKKFIDLDFIESNGVNLASTWRQHDSPEAEAEAEADKKDPCSSTDSLFEVFWFNYPKKVGKAAALKAWKKIKKPAEVLEMIKSTLPQQMESKQWLKENGQFIPHPATYLNQGRWEDEVDE